MTLLETLKEYTLWLAGWAVAILVLGWVMSCLPTGRDDTDEPGWFGKRSGVEPVIDHRTGCQYLRTRDGGITPRLDVDGRQIGCKRDA